MIAPMAVEIRPEQPEESVQVRAVNALAFGRDDEGRLVDAVRQREESLISLVAVDGDTVVGHILFSPVTIATPEGNTRRSVLARCRFIEISSARASAGR